MQGKGGEKGEGEGQAEIGQIGFLGVSDAACSSGCALQNSRVSHEAKLTKIIKS